ncbi:MAG TPA: hypothetical protein VHD56_19805 [Tepidisphaeraceae bacterium]|nr:hypothetical protein [Tepidisphaeraceae bacterium]
MFTIVQIAYWLALSTWFGSVLFVAIAIPIIFRTIGEADPTLPKVLSVNLDGQHATLLAGTIAMKLIKSLSAWQIGCAGILLISIILQWVLIQPFGLDLLPMLLRSGLFLASTILLIYDWRVLWPGIEKFRSEYIEHADEPDIANPAKDQFDHLQTQSFNVLKIILVLLLGLILFSGDIHLRTMTISMQP